MILLCTIRIIQTCLQYMRRRMGKPTICILGENKSADQLRSKYYSSFFLFQNFQPLTNFCDCTARVVSDLVGTQIVGFHKRIHPEKTPSNLGSFMFLISFSPIQVWIKLNCNDENRMWGVTYLPTQRAHDVKMTSYQRRSDAMCLLGRDASFFSLINGQT